MVPDIVNFCGGYLSGIYGTLFSKTELSAAFPGHLPCRAWQRLTGVGRWDENETSQKHQNW